MSALELVNPVFPPTSPEAEAALLGALLINAPRVMPMIEETLRPHHFSNAVFSHVFDVALSMWRRDQSIDAIAIRSKLDPDRLGDTKPEKILASLLSSMVGILNAPDYAQIIVDTWLRRELFHLAEVLKRDAVVPHERTAQDLLEEAEERLYSVISGQDDTRPTTSVSDAIYRALEAGEAAFNRGDGLAGLSWGYNGLDRMTGGLLAEGLYIIGARPAMGKTALGLGIATRSAACCGRVLYWSGEMSAEQLGARLGAAGAHLSTRSVFTGRRYDIPPDVETGRHAPLADYQWGDLLKAQQAAQAVPLEIDDRPNLTVNALRARARRMMRSKSGLKMIVIDYVGLMHGSDSARRQGRYAETTEISQDLKALAKELHIPVIVLAQLNREVEKREDKRPTEADLRDSGGLEQDADLVGFLYRDHYYLKREFEGDGIKRRERETTEAFERRVTEMTDRLQSAEGKAQIFIRKNRHGATGTVNLRFNSDSTWFRDASEDARSPAWIVKSEGAP